MKILKNHDELVYVCNEDKYKFFIEKKYLIPILRTPRELNHSYQIKKLTTYCLYISDDIISESEYIHKYIKEYENKVIINRFTHEKIVGYHNKFSNKKTKWYQLHLMKPAHIFLPHFWREHIYIPFSVKPIISDNSFILVYTSNPEKLWLYLNSTIFYLTMELYSRRLGGGVGECEVIDYNIFPVPSLDIIDRIDYDMNKLLNRQSQVYYNEVNDINRRELDIAVLHALGFSEDEINNLLEQLYIDFITLVHNRLIKSGRKRDIISLEKTRQRINIE